jgi:lysophospholipase
MFRFPFLSFAPTAPSAAEPPRGRAQDEFRERQPVRRSRERRAAGTEPARAEFRHVPAPAPYDFIGTLRTAEGARLRYGIARPKGRVRGSVLLLQGRAECLEKYREIVTGLSRRGLMVYSFDWHGQGLSGRPPHGHGSRRVRSFDDYLEDLDLFLREVWCRPPAQRFIVAHSTGGHVALRHMAERGLKVAGALLCAPMIDLHTRRWPRWLARLLAGSCVALGLGDCLVPGERSLLPSARRFEGNHLTGDPERFRILPELVRRHPELECRGATYRWVNAAFRSIERLSRPGIAESIASPVTVLAGSHDRLTDTEASRRFAARLPKGRFVLMEAARHEIMMEHDRVQTEFWRAVDRMLEGAG